jgi:hypothetical protein
MYRLESEKLENNSLDAEWFLEFKGWDNRAQERFLKGILWMGGRVIFL